MPLRIIREFPQFLNDLATYRSERQPIIHDFLYERQALILYADPGVGKSVISQQGFLSLVQGKPLFGDLEIPQPQSTYYLQLEGDYGEYVDRARMMLTGMGVQEGAGYAPLIWDESRAAEVCNREWVAETVASMEKISPKVVIVDPLYKLTSLGISSEEGSRALIRFFDLIQAEFGCALWINHHTRRAQAIQGQPVKDVDPFYGSQWLKAYADTIYHATRTSDCKVGLFNAKTRGSDVKKEILLTFDPETFLCHVEGNPSAMTGSEKVLNYYRNLLKSGITETDFYAVREACGISIVHLRRIQRRHLSLGIIRCNKVLNKRKIWEIIPNSF